MAHMTNSSTVSVPAAFAAVPGWQKSQAVPSDRHSGRLTLVFPHADSWLWLCGPDRAQPGRTWRAHDGVSGVCHGSHHSSLHFWGRFW